MQDLELLRCYANEGSELAFRELVNRHVNVIHSAVLRQVGGDAHLAQDIVQRVFISLARKAKTLPAPTIVLGWLYTAARLEAARALRTEIRRRQREEKAHAMNAPNRETSDEAVPWKEVAPILDNAMAALTDADRAAVLLRYFSGKSFSEIGQAFALSEGAARKRVDRAIEKLRQVLRRRGLVSSCAALGVTLSAHAATAPSSALLEVLAISNWGGLASNAAVKTGIFMGINKVTAGVTSMILLAAGVLVTGYVNRRNQQREFNSIQQSLSDTARRSAGSAQALASLRQEIAARPVTPSAPIGLVSPPVTRPNFRTNPEYQRLTITASLSRRHQEFQRLYRRLGLNAAQVTDFENIMAIQDQANLDAAAIKEQGGDPQTVFTHSGPDWSDAMKSLLGDAGFAQLEDYLKTMPVRRFVDSLAGPTASLGIPLSLEQADQLAEAALANDATYKSGKGTDPGTVNWEAVWPAASHILSGEQLEIFRTIVTTWQQQKEIQRLLNSKRNDHG
jgi:RNA polymerase sigma factor (sigma-70 family)